MMLRNAHHEIKAWGRAHDREIDHKSIFTLVNFTSSKRTVRHLEH